MNKNKLTIICTAGIFLVLGSGCVSTSKYKKLQSDSDSLKQQLDQTSAKLKEAETQNALLSQEKTQLEKQTAETQNQYQTLFNQLQQEVQAGELKVTQYKNMLSVDVAEQIFFDSGRANLKASGKSVLKKVGDALAQYNDKVIRVVGHTDNVPLGKAAQAVFPTNWELSVARATNVVRFLQDTCKINPDRLIASGRGEFSPVAPNDTPEGRKKNRRIEITLIDKSLVESMQEKPQ